jgi:hypothetical protein
VSGKKEAPRPEPRLAQSEEPRVYCIIVKRERGGISIAEGEVAESVVSIKRRRQPEVWDFTLGKLTGWLEERFQR